MFRSFSIGRLTATQRGLPEYGLLIESTMTGRPRRRARSGEDSVLADTARRRSSLSKVGYEWKSLLQRTPLGRG